MKKTIAFSILMLLSIASYAIDKEPIKSVISDVIVYTQGAQVTRKASFNVKAGITQLMIEGVSQYTDPRSIQVKANGAVILVDSKFEVYYPEPKIVKLEGLPLKIRKEIDALEDSISDLNFQYKDLSDELDVLTYTKSIINNNGAIRGTGKVNDSIQLLKAALEFYQVKMNEINKKMQLLTKKRTELSAVLAIKNERLVALKNYQMSTEPDAPLGPIYRIVVTLQAKEIASGKLTCSYLVSNASWVPTYDLRCDMGTGKVNLTYKANIQQSTGEKWDEVLLTLSTNNPGQNKTKPELHPWYISYNNGSYNTNDFGRASNVALTASPSMKLDFNAGYSESNVEFKKEERDAETLENFTTMIDRMISAEYRIDLPYTIESSGEEHLVLVRNIDLDAKYKYYTVPKLDPSVYLVAEILRLDELQLVPSTANIFFDGTYMGETYINPGQMSDTLVLSLGKDPNILARRTLLKKEIKERIINDKMEKTYSFEISVKNLKTTNVELVIQDQLPISNNADIVVEIEDLDKAEYDSTTGALKWKVNLKSRETQVIKFSYKIRHPKDQKVIIN